jgi:hypothetical protein
MPVITGPHNNSDICLSVGIIDSDAMFCLEWTF